MFTPKRRGQGPPQASTSEKRNWASLHSHTKSEGQAGEKRDKPIKERALSIWLPGQRTRHSKHAESGDQGNLPESPTDDEGETHRRRRSWGFHIPLPATPAPITISQNRTPGWDTPWSDRARQSLDDSGSHGSNLASRQDSFANANGAADEPPNGRKRSKWYRRRKRLRMFILYNAYVPLVSLLRPLCWWISCSDIVLFNP